MHTVIAECRARFVRVIAPREKADASVVHTEGIIPMCARFIAAVGRTESFTAAFVGNSHAPVWERWTISAI